MSRRSNFPVFASSVSGAFSFCFGVCPALVAPSAAVLQQQSWMFLESLQLDDTQSQMERSSVSSDFNKM